MESCMYGCLLLKEIEKLFIECAANFLSRSLLEKQEGGECNKEWEVRDGEQK